MAQSDPRVRVQVQTKTPETALRQTRPSVYEQVDT